MDDKTRLSAGRDGERDFMEEGRKLFAGPCDFIWASARPNDFPPPGPAEFAFAGRSNVGKSSLINALTGRRTLARVSNTPGRTQQLNFFALGERARLIDMPGYGYAAVSKTKSSSWEVLMRDYLRGRAQLTRVYVLIDGRRGIMPPDLEMFNVLDRAAMSYALVLTKRDAVKAGDTDRICDEVSAAIRRRGAAFPELLFTSSDTGAGVADLRAAIAQLLADRGADGPKPADGSL